jgi:hypothetical protein
VLPVVTLAVGSTVAAIALSADRRRTLVQLAFGMLLAFLATSLAILAAQDAIVGVASDEHRGAAQEVVTAVFASLLDATALLSRARRPSGRSLDPARVPSGWARGDLNPHEVALTGT